jgi:uncharacterized protein YodC (DUF2158 family)
VLQSTKRELPAVCRAFQPGPSVANVAELVDALDLGSSGATRESSSLSFRTKSKEPDAGSLAETRESRPAFPPVGNEGARCRFFSGNARKRTRFSPVGNGRARCRFFSGNARKRTRFSPVGNGRARCRFFSGNARKRTRFSPTGNANSRFRYRGASTHIRGVQGRRTSIPGFANQLPGICHVASYLALLAELWRVRPAHWAPKWVK